MTNKLINKDFSEEKNTFLRQLVDMSQEIFDNIDIIYIGAIGDSLYDNKQLFNEMVSIYAGDKQEVLTYYLKFTGTKLTNISVNDFEGSNFKIKYIHVDELLDMIEAQKTEMLDILFGALSQVSAFITPKMNMIIRTKNLITSEVKEKLLNEVISCKTVKKGMKEKTIQLFNNGTIFFPIAVDSNISLCDLKNTKIENEKEILSHRISMLRKKI